MDELQKPHTETDTSQNSPNSLTVVGRLSLKQGLYRKSPVPLSDYITLERLAEELGTEVQRLGPLIQHQYIRIMDAKEEMGDSVAARPTLEVMAWLRTMFLPIELRPYIPLSEAMMVLDATEDDLRYICATDDIPLYDDPVFGELLSVTGFLVLRRGIVAMHNPMRSDRQMLMMILGELHNVRDLGRLKPLPYSAKLEGEIRRIAKMPEPDRSFRASDFWTAYRDAETLVECLEKLDLKPSSQSKRISERVANMGRRLAGREKKKDASPNAPSSSLDPSDSECSESDSTTIPEQESISTGHAHDESSDASQCAR